MPMALITGATSGIGASVAQGLAKQGYDVIIAGRSLEKMRATQQALMQQTQSISIEQVDLASLASIEAFVSRVRGTYPPFHLLINNAGVFTSKRTLTTDGIEMNFAVNHLAPFLVTWRLMPHLQPGARIVTVNSDGHEKAQLSRADFAPSAPFSMQGTYAKSKLANMATIVEMAQRVSNTRATINGVHPGAVATNIGNVGGIMQVAWNVMKRFLLTPEQGSQTPLWVATAPEVAQVTGEYFKNKAIAPMNPLIHDAAFRQMVWEQTLRLTHIPATVPFPPVEETDFAVS